MKNYYFLANALPELYIDAKPVIAFYDVMTLFEENLSKRDLNQVKKLRLYYDLINIYHMLEGDELDFRSNLGVNELKEALLNEDQLPLYVFEFFNTYSEKEEQLAHFPLLISQYYRNEGQKAPVIKNFLSFEWFLKIVLSAIRAHRLEKSLEHELRFEDPLDDSIFPILAKKSYTLSDLAEVYPTLAQDLEGSLGHPLEEEYAIAEFRFNYYAKAQIGHPFSLQFLLAYAMQLMIVEDFNGYDQERGEQILNTIVKDNT